MVQIIFLLDSADLEQGSAGYSPGRKSGLWPASVYRFKLRMVFTFLKGLKKTKTKSPERTFNRDHM